MGNPISGTVYTRPDRPQYPWRYFAEVVTADPFAIAQVTADQVHWSFCITSIHVSTQAQMAYFILTQDFNGQTDTVVEAMVPAAGGGGPSTLGGTTVSLVFPTPLVIEAQTAWDLNGVGTTQGQLFTATLAGFWAQNDLASLSDSHIVRGPGDASTPRGRQPVRPPST
jgi:hypothetical protein